jgi:hypothetical protein
MMMTGRRERRVLKTEKRGVRACLVKLALVFHVDGEDT